MLQPVYHSASSVHHQHIESSVVTHVPQQCIRQMLHIVDFIQCIETDLEIEK